MESKKRIDTRKLLVAAIFIFSLAGLGVSQVYGQTKMGEGGTNHSQKFVDTPVAPIDEKVIPTQTLTPTSSSYEIADALMQLGRPDLAYLQIQTAIAEDPLYFMATEAKPTDVIETSTTEDDTKDETQPDVYEGKLKRSFYVWVEKAKAAIIEFLEFIGVLLAGGLSVYYLIRMLFYFFKCKFDIGDFTEGVDISCKPKEGFQALVEREIWRLSSRNGLKERDIVYQPLQDIDLSSTTLFKLGEIGQVMKILNFIFPPRLVVLTGTLHYSSKKGAGVTLQIVLKKKRIIDEITLWQSEYDPQFIASTQSAESECFYRLAEPAALWVVWHLQSKFNGKCECGLFRWIREKIFKKPSHHLELIKIFGTANLASYMSNYIGSQYFRYCPDKVEGKQSLIAAYDLDRKNRQVLFNLANLDIYNITKKHYTENPKSLEIDYSKPRNLLNRVIELSENAIPEAHIKENDHEQKSKELNKDDPQKVVDSLYALAYYHLGAIREYEYIISKYQGKVPEEILDQFMKCQDILKLIEQNAEKSKKKKKEKMISDELKEMMEAAIFGAKCLSDLSKTGKYECAKVYDVVSSSLAYNLACNEATLAGYLDAKKTKKQTESEKKEIKQYLENASKHLLTALQDAPTAEPWSKNDPSLEALRTLMVDYEATPKLIKYSYPRALNDIFGISPVYIEKLKKIPGLVTSDDLLKTGAEKNGRKYLRKKTKLPLDLLENWIKQADLMRVEWISGAYAELLIQSGVDSIAELRKQNGVKLRSKMDRIHKANPLDDYLPSLIELNKWIVKAKSLGIILKIEM